MKKNYGRKERRRLMHQNKIAEGKKRAKLEIFRQKMAAKKGDTKR